MRYNQLIELLNKAYCIYSNFACACILVDTNNNEYQGVNVENASYPVTLCAERNAIGRMIVDSTGEIPLLSHIYVMTDSIDENSSPCGMCRQALWEFSDDNTLITIYSKNNTKKTYQFKQLIPLGFNYKALNSR
ncbi:cytidine deaminase [Mycoplasma sp. E35C]|uniref:cytidine deaminase n=1 Tax=Mycoplasma sp. E35C TaxID=2801918 RepID=UPI001CA3C3F3|nr:cytidine deaminase [Mycoplasma sp. E35C]QZX49021.1 cytidine deaminase [Mycoplasma sp. E35C]